MGTFSLEGVFYRSNDKMRDEMGAFGPNQEFTTLLDGFEVVLNVSDTLVLPSGGADPITCVMVKIRNNTGIINLQIEGQSDTVNVVCDDFFCMFGVDLKSVTITATTAVTIDYIVGG